jgi:drug/metabolite transporter (DMT)-like permease
VPPPKSNFALVFWLLFAIGLWGGNNAGTKYLMAYWPAAWTGASRFFCAGLVLLAILRWTTWLGVSSPISATLRQRLWWQGGLSLAAYIVCFNSALRFTSASHVALYLGASPVWALLWEGRPALTLDTLRRYGAASLALLGLLVLFWPALRFSSTTWLGEVLGLLASVLWTNYGRQCRVFGAHLTGAQMTAHTMYRAGMLLAPLAVLEIVRSGLVVRGDLVAIQGYCIVAGGVTAFAIWSNTLRYWPTSQVLLFNNLIPLSTTTWAHFWLGEPITPGFWLAMGLVVSGVALAQINWGKPIVSETAPPE